VKGGTIVSFPKGLSSRNLAIRVEGRTTEVVHALSERTARNPCSTNVPCGECGKPLMKFPTAGAMFCFTVAVRVIVAGASSTFRHCGALIADDEYCPEGTEVCGMYDLPDRRSNEPYTGSLRDSFLRRSPLLHNQPVVPPCGRSEV